MKKVPRDELPPNHKEGFGSDSDRNQNLSTVPPRPVEYLNAISDRASVLKSYARTSENAHSESLVNSGLDAAERLAVQSTIPKGHGQLLVIGSGTGWDALEFARLGHKVVGLDLARELIIKAAARCKGQQWTQSSLSPMPRRFHYERGDSIASSR